jgi:hypothetical protein
MTADRPAGPYRGAGKLAPMRSSEHQAGAGRALQVRLPSARNPFAGGADGAPAVPPVQSFLFGHSRAEVVYDCR